MRCLLIGMMACLAGGAQAATTVTELDGNILCDGKALTLAGIDAEPALSPDGQTVAFIRYPNDDRTTGVSDTSELWLGDCAAGTTRKLLAPKPDESTPKDNLTEFTAPTFSLDGGFVYVETNAWVMSAAIHQVNIKTGAQKFVTDGNSLAVIRTGPYRGYLLAQQHRYHDGGGSYDPTYLIRPDGRIMFMVPGTDNEGEIDLTAAWLKKKGWTSW